jgi:hypothetical protein
MWENILERGRLHLTIWRVRIACWILKATYTHTEYAILSAFPPQQWLHERVSVLRYMYIVGLIETYNLRPVGYFQGRNLPGFYSSIMSQRQL